MNTNEFKPATAFVDKKPKKEGKAKERVTKYLIKIKDDKIEYLLKDMQEEINKKDKEIITLQNLYNGLKLEYNQFRDSLLSDRYLNLFELKNADETDINSN